MKNKIYVVFLVVFLTIMSLTAIIRVSADSGFDASYDSGGGSYSSSSDYSYSSSSSSSSSGSGHVPTSEEVGFYGYIFAVLIVFFIISGNLEKRELKNITKIQILYFLIATGIFIYIFRLPAIIVSVIVGLIVIICIIASLIDNHKNKLIKKNKYDYLNTDELKKELFSIYERIQYAWAENNVDSVRNLLTDELYNNYKMQIESMLVLGEKNIMSDIKFIDMMVKNISAENGFNTIEVIMEVECKDYIVNKDNVVIRGGKDLVHDYTYKMTFVKNSNNNVESCPNCGNKLGPGMSEVCGYCHSTLVHNSTTYVLSKKEMLKQRIK